MPHQRTRGGREQVKAMRGLGAKRQRQIGVPAARRVIVDADAIEACVLATGDERGDVWQGPADRDSKSDANPSHSTCFFNSALR